MKSQVIASRCWRYPYQAWAGAEKPLPFMTALINTLNRSSSSILLIFAEKLLKYSLKIMGFVQLQTGEAFLKTHQHFSARNKLSFVLQNWMETLKEVVSLFLSHLQYLANLSFLSYFPRLTNLNGEKKGPAGVLYFVLTCRLRPWVPDVIQSKLKTMSLSIDFREHQIKL